MQRSLVASTALLYSEKRPFSNFYHLVIWQTLIQSELKIYFYMHVLKEQVGFRVRLAQGRLHVGQQSLGKRDRTQNLLGS